MGLAETKKESKTNQFDHFSIIRLLRTALSLQQRTVSVRVIFCLWAAQVTRVVRREPHFGEWNV